MCPIFGSSQFWLLWSFYSPSDDAVYRYHANDLSDPDQLILVGEVDRGYTNNEGILVFGDKTIPLKTDTIYCIRETIAPTGYMPNKDPHYFVIAKQNEEDGSYQSYPSFIKNITIFELSHGEHVFRMHDVPSGPPLPATGGIGTGAIYAFGCSLLAVFLIGSTVMLIKRKKARHPV